jgi:hypothetical protein
MESLTTGPELENSQGQSRPRLPAFAPPDVRYATKVLQRRLKILLGRGACLLELIETIGKPRHINSDVV